MRIERRHAPGAKQQACKGNCLIHQLAAGRDIPSDVGCGNMCGLSTGGPDKLIMPPWVKPGTTLNATCFLGETLPARFRVVYRYRKKR